VLLGLIGWWLRAIDKVGRLTRPPHVSNPQRGPTSSGRGRGARALELAQTPTPEERGRRQSRSAFGVSLWLQARAAILSPTVDNRDREKRPLRGGVTVPVPGARRHLVPRLCGRAGNVARFPCGIRLKAQHSVTACAQPRKLSRTCATLSTAWGRQVGSQGAPLRPCTCRLKNGCLN
jgi:hypothetical protein